MNYFYNFYSNFKNLTNPKVSFKTKYVKSNPFLIKNAILKPIFKDEFKIFKSYNWTSLKNNASLQSVNDELYTYNEIIDEKCINLNDNYKNNDINNSIIANFNILTIFLIINILFFYKTK